MTPSFFPSHLKCVINVIQMHGYCDIYISAETLRLEVMRDLLDGGGGFFLLGCGGTFSIFIHRLCSLLEVLDEIMLLYYMWSLVFLVKQIVFHFQSHFVNPFLLIKFFFLTEFFSDYLVLPAFS